jgi:triosephosphate isomerase
MATRTPLMAGNWKLNLDHLQATHHVQKLDWSLKDGKHDFAAVEVAVLPPFTDLRSVQTLVQGDQLPLKYGAQDLSAHDDGAYTGEVSGAFLAKLGCTYVVVGHSERRQYHHEDDELVAQKVAAALRHDLSPIVCVGEGLDVRETGTHVKFVLGQVRGALAGLSAEQMGDVVIAYEPVWAIGTGEVATPEDAQEVCTAIREEIA